MSILDHNSKIDNKSQKKKSEKTMSLINHISELRKRLLTSSISVLLFFALTLTIASKLIEILSIPLKLSWPEQQLKLHFTGPLDVFWANIKVSFLSSIILSSPVWIYQLWKFVEPALYKKERKLLGPFILISIAFFILGVLFAYFIILPIALKFLIGLGMEVGTAIITINDYLSLVGMMLLGFGIVFELPLLLILLIYLELLSIEYLQASRRYTIVICFIVAAILTPPDPLSQIGMAIPLYIMHELALVIAKFIVIPHKKTS